MITVYTCKLHLLLLLYIIKQLYFVLSAQSLKWYRVDENIFLVYVA